MYIKQQQPEQHTHASKTSAHKSNDNLIFVRIVVVATFVGQSLMQMKCIQTAD